MCIRDSSKVNQRPLDPEDDMDVCNAKLIAIDERTAVGKVHVLDDPATLAEGCQRGRTQRSEVWPLKHREDGLPVIEEARCDGRLGDNEDSELEGIDTPILVGLVRRRRHKRTTKLGELGEGKINHSGGVAVDILADGQQWNAAVGDTQCL